MATYEERTRRGPPRWAVRLITLGLSLTFALILAECFLRFGVRRYTYAAEAVYERSITRIWSRTPGDRYAREHPDTGVEHAVIHNNLALRQHRAIEVPKPEGELRLGFFGDSFTENLRVPAYASFTEPLDYLLNDAGVRTTVLNFGVDGYGPDQSFLYWQEAEAAEELDYVFYVFCGNDIRNVYENGLFEVDPDGMLQSRARSTPVWTRLLSRLHLTYLVLDVRNRAVARHRAGLIRRFAVQDNRRLIRERQERNKDDVALRIEEELLHSRSSPELSHNLAIFDALLDTWRAAVEQRGARFVVVVLPNVPSAVRDRLFRGFDVFDLRTSFEARGDGAGSWRFANDGHWNERGNAWAAEDLFEFLGPELELRLAPPDAGQRLCRFYRAFESWLPEGCGTIPPPDDDVLRGIRTRYTGLEDR